MREKAQYAIVKMCAWLGVSTSGFYEWRDRPASATARRRARLAALIEWIFDDSDETYGHRRIHAALARQGERVQPGAGAGDHARAGPGAVPASAVPADDHRGRRRRPGARPGRRATSPPTRRAPSSSATSPIIPTWQGWLYLATVIDCYTKECIGYALADHMRADLVIDALQMAARNYTLADGAIFHSDRGTQYTSQSFAGAAAELGIRRSVGRTGSCFDNALAESFNASLKVERVHRTVYPTREHARADVARYIEFRYNTKRLHSALGYRTPQEVHDEYLNQQLAA